MSDIDLIALAKSCSRVRTDIGRMLLTQDGSDNRVAAVERLEASLKALLRLARNGDCGLFLEIAGELA